MAGGYDGEIRINTRINTNEFNTGINSIVSSIGRIAKTLGLAISATAFIRFGKEAIELASDLTEVDNVVNKAFGNMRSEMDALAESAIKNLGMSRLMAYQTGSTFMSMGKSMLTSSEDAKNMALELTKLTANMASFFNVSQDLASIALKSIYTGETETLKQYGVVMTEVNLKQFALEQGITKSYSAMSQSEKVMLRYQYVMSQLSYIGDDFIDTQDSWANQTRILSEQWKEFMGIIGNGLITVLTPVVQFLNKIVATLINVANTISAIMSKIFGIQMQQMSTTASAAEDVADGYSDAADSMDDYANSVSNAAKKAKGALASFDELNVISKNQTSGSGSGGSGGTGGTEIKPFDTSTQESVIDQLEGKYKKFFDYLKKLKDDFINGFQTSWNNLDVDSQVESIKKSLEGIRKSLVDIFADKSVLSAADNFAQTVVTSLGSISASVISIGTTIAENFLGGLNSYLEENSGRIKQFLINCFNISSDITTLIAEAFETIADIFSVFGNENGQQITADLIQIFADAFSFITETALKFVRDMLDILVTPISDNSESIKNTLNNLLGFIQQITGVLSDIVRQITDGLTALYDEHLKPFFDSVRDGLSEIMAEALKLWDEYIQPVLNYIAKLVTETYEQHLKPVIDNLMGLLGAVIDLIKTLWEVVLKPLIIWLMNTLAPKVSDIAKKVSGFVSAAVDIILDCIGFVLKNAENLIKIVTALINGDWKGAWNAARDYVKDGANGIIKIIETMVNKIIDGINTLTNGFNSIGFDVPDFLGGGSWHPSIPTIPNVNLPRLANGGITTGSTLANIGEAGREAVLPLENNLSYMKPLAEMIASEMKGVQTVRIVADEGKIFKIVREEANDYYRRTGSPAFDF